MTDNEIIKALECCKEVGKCRACPLWAKTKCTERVAENALDLINRQKAEIERLQKHNKEHKFCNLLGNVLVYSQSLEDYNDMRKGLISVGITKFAERLKHTLIINNEENTEIFDYDYTLETIDQIAKELKGGGTDA